MLYKVTRCIMVMTPRLERTRHLAPKCNRLVAVYTIPSHACFRTRTCRTYSSVKDTSSGRIARAAMSEWTIAVTVLIICFFNVACYATIRSSRLLRVSHRKAGAPAAAAPLTWFAWDLVEARDLVRWPTSSKQNDW